VVADIGPERNELLLWVQLQGSADGATPSATTPSQGAQEDPAGAPARSIRPSAVEETLLDPETGIGAVGALRRDLGQLSPLARYTLIQVLAVPTAGGWAEAQDLAAATRALVAAAPFVLRSRDRVYRVAPPSLVVFLDGVQGVSAEAVRARLEVALRKTPLGARLVNVGLAARVVTPGEGHEAPNQVNPRAPVATQDLPRIASQPPPAMPEVRAG
jgi:hypothetical protein